EHIRELIEFAKQEAGIQERPVAMAPLLGVATKPPVILVADNDPSVKERIEPFLSHAGYEVVIAASAQEALRKAVQLQPLAILIVDDDPQNIRLVKAMLKPFNIEVMVADGGKAGLELALKKKPDLIILDLMMPDVDGFEVVTKLREDPGASQIPILIYTAKNITSEDRDRLQGNIQSII